MPTGVDLFKNGTRLALSKFLTVTLEIAANGVFSPEFHFVTRGFRQAFFERFVPIRLCSDLFLLTFMQLPVVGVLQCPSFRPPAD